MAAFGLAETAELAVRISLKDDLSRGINGLTTKVNRLQTGLGKVGTGLKNAARNLTGPALVGGGLLAFAIKGGLEDLSELESAVTSVDGAIEQMGLTGKVTGQQVADWANEIEASIGAAFDDKAITAAATTLIRFGKVTDRNLRPALTVVADLATKTGDVDSAATLLAKALADPEKAAGKLARSGVVLTKQQQEQIKTMVEAGDVAGAQALLLDEVTKATEGAAKASQGKYARAMSVLGDVQEDARKALAEGFLPVLEKVASLLSTELAKPQTLANIREFGEGLAKGLDSLVEIARNLPWGTIGDSLKVAGAGAKAILGAFTSLPPWVQTAVLTGWGLNKLTGGLLGDLASGLVKGVLGIRAGIVNVSGPVTGGGAAGAAGAAGGASKLGRIANAVKVLGAVTIAGASIAALAETFVGVNEQTSAQGKGIHETQRVYLEQSPPLSALQTSLAAVNTGINQIQANPLYTLVQGSALDELRTMRSELQRQIVIEQGKESFAKNAASIASRENAATKQKVADVATKAQATSNAVKNAQSIASRENSAQKTEISLVKNSIVTNAAAQAARDASERAATVTAGSRAASASRSAGDRAAAATNGAAGRIVAAIYGARPVINVTTVNRHTTTNNRYGPTGGSSNTSRTYSGV